MKIYEKHLLKCCGFLPLNKIRGAKSSVHIFQKELNQIIFVSGGHWLSVAHQHPSRQAPRKTDSPLLRSLASLCTLVHKQTLMISWLKLILRKKLWGKVWFGNLESAQKSTDYSKCEVPAAAAKSLQSCPTLCDPIDGSPPGSHVSGILQARTLEWVAISFSNARKWKVKVKSLSRVRLLATPWTAAYQAPPSMGFSRQKYWSGVPLPSPEPVKIIFYSKSGEQSFCISAWTEPRWILPRNNHSHWRNLH